MSGLHHAVEQYLGLRRSLGFTLERHERLLDDFVGYVERSGATTVTTDLALAWATSSSGSSRAWRAQRLSVVRGFARYLKAVDPDAEVPPCGLLPAGTRRKAAYLYSDTDIAALMAAARSLHSPLRAATFETIVGLLAVTGLRPGEVIHLDDGDVDLDGGVLLVRATKFGKDRRVPLHPSAVEALRGYAQRRDHLCRRRRGRSFFVSTAGTRLLHCDLNKTWRDLVREARLDHPSLPRRPRPHDARHSFAVKTVIDWYHAGLDVTARLPWLSTFLGHGDPSATYWYLSAAPELLALAGQRLEAALEPTP